MKRARTLLSAVAVVALTAGSAIAVTAPATAAVRKPWTRTSDFNGDGYNDLAIGAPGGTIAGKAGAGYVTIIPGSKKGLIPAKKRFLSQATAGVPGDPAAGKWFGETLATADFNSDGYADLVVGTPGDTNTNAVVKPGSLTIFFGSRNGLGRPQRLLGKSGGLGSAVTAADMNGDGRPEILATESPSNFGRVVRFTIAKKAVKAVRTTTEACCGLGGIAAGDVNGDGYDDIVTLFRQVGGSNSFSLFTGSKAGLRTEAAQINVYDGGADLALADLNRDGRADLVVGRPVTGRFGPNLGGEVFVFNGTRKGFDEQATTTITQDSPGVPETSEDYDWFGSAVAVGDITGDGNPELAIGAQRESLKTITAPGTITVLRGSGTGLSTKKAQLFARGVGGLGGKPQLNEQFGWIATIRDFNGDRKGDLAVTAIGGHASTEYPYYGDGSVTVLNGGANGAIAKGAKVITPASLHAPAKAAKFGWSQAR
jgi:hypothetical protein